MVRDSSRSISTAKTEALLWKSCRQMVCMRATSAIHSKITKRWQWFRCNNWGWKPSSLLTSTMDISPTVEETQQQAARSNLSTRRPISDRRSKHRLKAVRLVSRKTIAILITSRIRTLESKLWNRNMYKAIRWLAPDKSNYTSKWIHAFLISDNHKN